MFYLDTSAFVPLYAAEKSSAKLDAWLNKFGSAVFISEWTATEFYSALGLKVRMRELSRQQALAAMAAFNLDLRTSWNIVTPTASDYRRACDYLARLDTGLRSGDALHLAIAKNHDAKSIVSLDKNLIKAAHKLDIPAQVPI